MLNADIVKERQGWTLMQKIDHSLGVIDQFLSRTNNNAYVAFSGGKDSTVLMHLCEILMPDIKCVFVNTGCEYLDIIQFVNQCKEDGHNIEIIRPEMLPREVWAKYGFPLVSKEVAEQIASIRRNPNSKKSRVALTGEDTTMFMLKKRWRYLISAEYNTSNKCCDILKKRPSHIYTKRTGMFPIIGDMASESLLREKTYIRRGGCNVFSENPSSHPLSIWTDNDIWQFIKSNNIKVADIYYKGVSRTGCVACGFGCQFKSDHRLKILYDLYPKYYQTIMTWQNKGVPYRKALRDMLNKVGLVLPDEDSQLNLDFKF